MLLECGSYIQEQVARVSSDHHLPQSSTGERVNFGGKLSVIIGQLLNIAAKTSDLGKLQSIELESAASAAVQATMSGIRAGMSQSDLEAAACVAALSVEDKRAIREVIAEEHMVAVPENFKPYSPFELNGKSTTSRVVATSGKADQPGSPEATQQGVDTSHESEVTEVQSQATLTNQSDLEVDMGNGSADIQETTLESPTTPRMESESCAFMNAPKQPRIISELAARVFTPSPSEALSTQAARQWLGGAQQPFQLLLYPEVTFMCEVHAHLCSYEIIGLPLPAFFFVVVLFSRGFVCLL
jgi:hypothetical protein